MNDGILPILEYDLDDPNDISLAIYSTHDGGDTWDTNGTELTGLNPNLIYVFNISIHTLSPEIFAVICGNQVCITKDEANSWQEIPFTKGTPILFSLSSPEEGIIVTREEIAGVQDHIYQIWKTSDSGNHWVEIELPIRNN
jgi:photosystem II stability/assembly factor-like uncharacterized protein